MKNNLTSIKSKRFSSILLLAFFLLAFTGLVQADAYIQLDVVGCDVEVSVSDSGCDNGECSGDLACICASRGEHIHWNESGNNSFKFKFDSGSPLKNNCGKNFKKGKQKCVVKEDLSSGDSYSYEIYLKQCDDGTDPRIVIK